MIVAELIAKLQEMPQDMDAVCHDGVYGFCWDIEAIQQLTYDQEGGKIDVVQISPWEIRRDPIEP